VKYVVSFSGGLSSFEALRRCLAKHGHESTIAIFANVGSVAENGVTVSGEDDDTFRFKRDVEKLLKVNIVELRHHKYQNVWDAFFGERFMGNTRLDTCSKFLKREVIHRFQDNLGEEVVPVIGFSWLEQSRVEQYKKYCPNAWFPLTEPPYTDNEKISQFLRSYGVEPPRLYDTFLHNNCGGFCVKMGIGQLHDLWRTSKERYEYNERMEQKFREDINPDAAIFRKDKRPFTMKQYRELFEKGYKPKTAGQHGGCGGRCMVPLQGELF
jgi:hypothetical protein